MGSLANKYRPKDFDDVVEQSAVVSILKRQLETDNIKNCYLFTAQAGVGKTSLGRIIARKLNPDLAPTEIDAASNNSIDDIRKLIEDCQVKPLVGYYKIVILDECHALSNSAWQGLLKLIEEPPKNVVFIFCTTDSQKIPETILSRVQRFDLQRISLGGIINRLKDIISKESKEHNITYTEDALEYIAKIADGGLRSALSTLDKCLSYSLDINITNVLISIGKDYYTDFITLTNYIVDYKDKEVLELIENIYNQGKDIKQFIKNYSIFLLDTCKAISTNSFEYTQIPSYYVDQVKQLTDSVNKEFMLCLLDSIIKLSSSLRWETNPKQIIEMHLLLLCRK